jgi:hypothetical protein
VLECTPLIFPSSVQESLGFHILAPANLLVRVLAKDGGNTDSLALVGMPGTDA